ncbi:hypothetical protein GCM10027403_07000 [Arthrobacter tecti]
MFAAIQGVPVHILSVESDYADLRVMPTFGIAPGPGCGARFDGMVKGFQKGRDGIGTAITARHGCRGVTWGSIQSPVSSG